MKKIKLFSEFINEVAGFDLNNPAGDGADLGKIISNNIGAKEVGNNSGSDVNKFQRSVGIGDGQPWCMAFIFYIFNEFSKKLGITNPVIKTGSVMEQWNKTGGKKITVEQARSNFSLVKPGQIMIATRPGGGSGSGHAGIISSVDYNAKKFTTIEGNVRLNKGQGVGSYNRSILVDGLIGFIDYFPDRSSDFDNSFTEAVKKKFPDADKSNVERRLPGDGIIGDETATSGDDAEDKKGSSGGLLGKIVSGARKFFNPDDSGGDVSAEDAVKAISAVTGR